MASYEQFTLNGEYTQYRKEDDYTKDIVIAIKVKGIVGTLET